MMGPVTESDHRARWDAETLAQAELIKDDPNRLDKAKSAAKVLADKEAKETKAMRKVAGKETTKRKEQKASSKGTTGVIGKGAANNFNVFKKI